MGHALLSLHLYLGSLPGLQHACLMPQLKCRWQQGPPKVWEKTTTEEAMGEQSQHVAEPGLGAKQGLSPEWKGRTTREHNLREGGEEAEKEGQRGRGKAMQCGSRGAEEVEEEEGRQRAEGGGGMGGQWQQGGWKAPWATALRGGSVKTWGVPCMQGVVHPEVWEHSLDSAICSLLLPCTALSSHVVCGHFEALALWDGALVSQAVVEDVWWSLSRMQGSMMPGHPVCHSLIV